MREIKSDNLGLLFNKLFPFKNLLPSSGFVEFEKKKKNKTVVIPWYKNEVKTDLIERVIERYNKNAAKGLVETYLQELEKNGFHLLEFETSSPLAVGLGLPSFFENGLTFHHIYGVPCIPASSVKGLLRFVFLSMATGLIKFSSSEECKDIPKILEWKTDDIDFALKFLKDLDDSLTGSRSVEDFQRKLEKLISQNENEVELVNNNGEVEKFFELYLELFGNQHYKGKTIFADALPEDFKVALDVMNPHFVEYYQSSEKKRKDNGLYLIGDWHNPIPIFFLVVREGVFTFPVKVLGNNLNLVECLLKNGLELLGIGAKKGKGYGRLNKIGNN